MKKSGYLRIFVSYYKPHWKLFALDMACALCICMVDLAFPIVSRSSMQTLLPQKLFSAFFVVMALLAGAYVLKSVFYFIVTYWGTCWAYAWRRISGGTCSIICRISPFPFTTRTAPASS